MDVLNRAKTRPNFGNIGEVENLLNRAKTRYQERQALLPLAQRPADAPFEPVDFDADHDRNSHAATNLAKLFEDVVGCDQIVEKLGNWQKMAKNLKVLGKEPRDHIPTNFIFKGPPGTGKTTTARKMGQVYYDMGFLSSVEVIECSASDLVGQYVGQTGPKTKKLFEKALGRVLFIDEAYRLSQGHFAQEAIDELVGILTQEKFRGKLIVILAGYDQDMNQLMAINSGLSSRFPEEIVFPHISVPSCIKILKNKLLKHNITVPVLDDENSVDYSDITDLLEDLAAFPSWGNARDIETIAKKMTEKVFTQSAINSSATTPLVLSTADAVSCIQDMLKSRQERTGNLPAFNHTLRPSPPVATHTQTTSPPPVATGTSSASKSPTPQPQKKSPPPPKKGPGAKSKSPALSNGTAKAERDPGVSDEVWEQLLKNKRAAEEAEAKLQKDREEAEKAFRAAVAAAKAKEAEAKAKKAALAKARQEAIDAAILKQMEEEAARMREAARREEARVKAEKARREAARKLQEQQRAKEAAVQKKLREMGVCVQGFRWIPYAGGYRCAGGSHFVSNTQLGI